MRSRFHLLLENKVNEAVESLVESLVNGEAADYARYKEISGQIRGLRDSLKYCEEIEAENT